MSDDKKEGILDVIEKTFDHTEQKSEAAGTKRRSGIVHFDYPGQLPFSVLPGDVHSYYVTELVGYYTLSVNLVGTYTHTLGKFKSKEEANKCYYYFKGLIEPTSPENDKEVKDVAV